jgi:hypothetical protein
MSKHQRRDQQMLDVLQRLTEPLSDAADLPIALKRMAITDREQPAGDGNR